MNTKHIVNLPITYINYFIGITDVTGLSSNGGVTRFNYENLSSFMLGWDLLLNVNPITNKFWITIGY